jgi:FMN phosphatase YigB (HAD superfamily)
MISFVYFDIGGVVVRDFTGTQGEVELDRDLGVPKKQQRDFGKFWDEYELKLCTDMNLDDFIALAKKKFTINIPPNYSLLKNGIVDRFEANQSIWPIIKMVKEKCKIGLLTNMYPRMFNAIKEGGLLPDISWDIIINSSLEKVAKPNSRIYQIAEEKCGFRGKQILFIDNLLVNLKEPQKMDWNTFCYNPSNPEDSNKKLLVELDKLIK